MDKWGLVATIKAPLQDTLRFAAHHIDLGAHRLYLYLDDPDPATFDLLGAHPKVRVFACDAAHWRKRGNPRPVKHQTRQTLNATHAYARPAEVDWLGHIDVDEFLCPKSLFGKTLTALSAETQCARIRPVESLADGDGTAFKGFIPPGPDRARIVQRLYPTFGRYVKGGFLSHLAGKLFVRTGLPNLTFKIHNAIAGETENPGAVELGGVDLCHFHTRSWDHWIGAYRFRLQHGSYRAELAPAFTDKDGDQTLHGLLSTLDNHQGPDGLRAFFQELCADTPDHRRRLQTEGLLHLHDLDLDAKTRKHFPDFCPHIHNSETIGE